MIVCMFYKISQTTGHVLILVKFHLTMFIQFFFKYFFVSTFKRVENVLILSNLFLLDPSCRIQCYLVPVSLQYLFFQRHVTTQAIPFQLPSLKEFRVSLKKKILFKISVISQEIPICFIFWAKYLTYLLPPFPKLSKDALPPFTGYFINGYRIYVDIMTGEKLSIKVANMDFILWSVS